MPTVESKLTDIRAELRAETERGYRLHDGRVTVWVPKSSVQDNGDGTFTMPEWLAREKELI
jgi:hypothetical protein